jgi:hypothetical protein
MAELTLTQQEEKQLEELNREMAPQSGATAEAVSVQDICEYWRRYRRFWPILIGIVRRIPNYGEAIARLLEKIGQLLDTYCTNKP